MPIYEFECKKCRSRFDYLVRASQDGISCPKCKSKNLRRLISSFAFNSKDSQGNITASSSGCSGCLRPHCSTCSR
jgi:putative FmdB family regulatory protein